MTICNIVQSSLLLLSVVLLMNDVVLVFSAPSYRVVNGNRYANRRLSSLVALHSGSTLCSGSIIGPKLILSAAHCMCGAARMKWAFPKTPTIVNGVDFNNKRDVDQFVFTPESDTICRQNQPSGNFVGGHDLVLITVKQNFDINGNDITITKLSDNRGHSTTITVAGYGQDENKESGTLLWGNIQTLSACPSWITNGDRAICYDASTNYQKTAPGDSGGPSFDANYNVLGVTSGAMTIVRGRETIETGVMASVKANMDWIKSTARSLGSAL